MKLTSSLTSARLLVLVASCASVLAASSSACSAEAVKPQVLDKVRALAFSPDGRHFASTDIAEWIHLWDLHTGKVVRSFRSSDQDENEEISRVVFTPDGQRIISAGSDDTIKIWDTESGELIADLHEHDDDVMDLAISPDGKFFASGGSDGQLIVWDLDKASVVGRFKSEGGWGVRSVSYSTKGTFVAECTGDVCLPDTKSGEMRRLSDGMLTHIVRFGSLPTTIFVAPDVVAGEAAIVSFDLTKLGKKLVFEGRASFTNGMDVSADGKAVIAGDGAGMLRTWEARSGKQIVDIRADDEAVLAVAFSPSGKLAISSGEDGVVKLWHLATGALVLSFSASGGDYASWTPDMHFVTSPDYAWKIFSTFDVATGKFDPNDDFLDDAARPELVTQRLSEYLAR